MFLRLNLKKCLNIISKNPKFFVIYQLNFKIKKRKNYSEFLKSELIKKSNTIN